VNLYLGNSWPCAGALPSISAAKRASIAGVRLGPTPSVHSALGRGKLLDMNTNALVRKAVMLAAVSVRLFRVLLWSENLRGRTGRPQQLCTRSLI
jgi:hypothetical protein